MRPWRSYATCLADGPKPVAEVQANAKEAGIALGTLKRAQQRLGLKCTKASGWVMHRTGSHI